MSASDFWGTLKACCPSCKAGDVRYFFFDSDCRGNPPSAGVKCQSCPYELDHIPDWARDLIHTSRR